ncbi:citrate synthase [Duganella rhizosphaerae]|uniref:citrate/2-methylcitrate synthase n=1 Tax=Duganella rhizosphaerae TaxID=2885763 RepID=UPI0030E80F0A
MVWMTAAEALKVLNVRPQTLYANVSRGKIRAKSDEADPRRSLYHRDDIQRMASRSNGRRKIEMVSAQAMQWGDPVLPSAISTAADGRLLYRGHDAVTLSETATLEQIADLLWEAEPGQAQAAMAGASPAQAAIAPPASALGAGLLALALRSASDAPSMGRPAADLRAEAASILSTLAEAMIGPALAGRVTAGTDVGAPAAAGAPPATISQRLARAWQRPASEDLLRRALVLMADHELNASTFATRVAISTGASLAAGVLAGFTTLTGPLHGGASAEFAQLAAAARAHGAEAAVATWRASGRALPGFGHMLYAQGDPRARALMKLLPELQPHTDLAAAAEAQAGELPNIDFALTLLAAAHGLPDDAPFILFALGRCVGWLAHALEQVQARRPIRPRARYIGPSAGTC